jgi:ribonuclease G
MNKELFVSSTPHETKVGLVEDDLLADVYLERGNEYTFAVSIYKGRVTRVLPGMQSAFVDIGLSAMPSSTFPTSWSWKSTTTI